MKTKIHKLSLDDLVENSTVLLAIFCDEEDYRMAFLLNYFFALDFVRTEPVFDKKSTGYFSVFEYEDKKMYKKYQLIHNHCLVSQKQTIGQGLFSNEIISVEKQFALIHEHAKASFLLKITLDEDDLFIEKIIEKLKSIAQIYTVEIVNLQLIKNQDVLVF